ncbi:MAG: PEGA domain-containing protein [Polyangiaceae bacterium]
MRSSQRVILFTFLSCWYSNDAAATEAVATSRDPASVDARQEQKTPELERARGHFLQGVQFYSSGDYKLSLLEFRRSYDISKNYRILYNIGQVNQQLGNYTLALRALEQYLREGGDEVSSDRRTEVTTNIAILQTRVAHIQVVSNVDGAEILVDGFPADTKNAGAGITLDPGDHRVELRKSGYQNGGTVVTLAAGDVSKVRIQLVRVQSIVRVAAPANSTVTPQRDTTWQWVGWTTTATAALGAGITGVFAALQANELADLRNSSGSTQSQRDDIGSRARTFAIVSDVLTATAIAAGATSLYLTFGSKETKPSHPSSPSTRLAVSPVGMRFEHCF